MYMGSNIGDSWSPNVQGGSTITDTPHHSRWWRLQNYVSPSSMIPSASRSIGILLAEKRVEYVVWIPRSLRQTCRYNWLRIVASSLGFMYVGLELHYIPNLPATYKSKAIILKGFPIPHPSPQSGSMMKISGVRNYMGMTFKVLNVHKLLRQWTGSSK